MDEYSVYCFDREASICLVVLKRASILLVDLFENTIRGIHISIVYQIHLHAEEKERTFPVNHTIIHWNRISSFLAKPIEVNSFISYKIDGMF